MSEKVVVIAGDAPAAIGPYSHAIKVNNTVYVSGQIPLSAETMELVSDDFRAQAVQVFENLRAVCQASGGDLSDIVKLNLFLTDLSEFPMVNEVMSLYFTQPYPARAAVGVKQLPKGALVEADAIMFIE